MRTAVKWRNTNRNIASILWHRPARGLPDSARRKQTGGGFVEKPNDLAVMRRNDLRGELVRVARSFQDIFHLRRLTLPRRQEHHALRIVDYRRRDREATPRLGVNLHGDDQALRFVNRRIARKQRCSMAIVA